MMMVVSQVSLRASGAKLTRFLAASPHRAGKVKDGQRGRLGLGL